jgi:hypothetical protein
LHGLFQSLYQFDAAVDGLLVLLGMSREWIGQNFPDQTRGADAPKGDRA